MNIVLVTERFRNGGLETHLRGFMREVQRRGHRVSVITGARERLDTLRESVGERVLPIEWPQPLTAGAALGVIDRMVEFCRSQDADLLHLHPFLSLSLGCLAAARLGVPYVLTVHGPSNLRPGHAEGGTPVLERIAASASRVYCVCDELAEEVRERVPTDRVACLPNAVDLAHWRPTTRAGSGPWAVVGRLDEDKLGSVRHAVEMLCSAPDGVEARVFGDGSARGAFERWLADRSWGPRVRLEGHRDDLATVLREGFAGVAGMTRVVLEAGALGLPVVLAGYDGVKGLVEAGNMQALSRCNFSGRGLAPIDRGSLARQMSLLAAEPEPFQLRPWIEAHADESCVWALYLRDVADLPAPHLAWPRAWLRSMEADPDGEFFSSEVLLRSLAEGVFDSLQVRIRDREARQREQADALRAQKAAAEQHLAAAADRLATIEASETWRAALAMSRLRLRLAPRGTLRERLLESALRRLGVSRQGLIPGTDPAPPACATAGDPSPRTEGFRQQRPGPPRDVPGTVGFDGDGGDGGHTPRGGRARGRCPPSQAGVSPPRTPRAGRGRGCRWPFGASGGLMSRKATLARIVVVVLFAALAAGASGDDPLTTADVVRFLNAGISERTILSDLRYRGFAEPLDAEREATLREAGATETLVVAIRRAAPEASAAAPGSTSPSAPASPRPRGDSGAFPATGSGRKPTFSAITRSVRVPVSVLDKRGQPVLGLRGADFQVAEDGRPQEVTFFSGERRPLRIALALDISESMSDKMAEVSAALRRFIDLLEPSDEILVLTFSSDLHIEQDFTSDRELLERVFTRLQPAQGTALYDAAIEAIRRVAPGPAESKAVVLVTDGVDTASRATFGELLEIARHSEVPIFSLGIGSDTNFLNVFSPIGGIGRGPIGGPGRGPRGPGRGWPPGGRGGWPGGGGGGRGWPGSGGRGPMGQAQDFDARPLMDLADETGGRATILKGLQHDHGKVDRLQEAVETIAITLRHRYLVGYEPQTSKKGWRKIKVQVDRPSVSVQARKGYYTEG